MKDNDMSSPIYMS